MGEGVPSSASWFPPALGASSDFKSINTRASQCTEVPGVQEAHGAVTRELASFSQEQSHAQCGLLPVHSQKGKMWESKDKMGNGNMQSGQRCPGDSGVGKSERGARGQRWERAPRLGV